MIGEGETLTANSNIEALVKAAKISYVCWLVVNSAPIQLTKTGIIDPKYIPAELKKITLQNLKDSIAEDMREAGYTQLEFYVGNTSTEDTCGELSALFTECGNTY